MTCVIKTGWDQEIDCPDCGFSLCRCDDSTQPPAPLVDTSLAPRPGPGPARAIEREPQATGPVAGTAKTGCGAALLLSGKKCGDPFGASSRGGTDPRVYFCGTCAP